MPRLAPLDLDKLTQLLARLPVSASAADEAAGRKLNA